MIPFNATRTGIVSVPLLNSFSEKSGGLPCLLIKFTKDNPNKTKSEIVDGYLHERRSTIDESTTNQLLKFKNDNV